MLEHRQIMKPPIYMTEIAKAFVQTTLDLETRIFLDGIDPALQGFRIRCHDRYGILPEVMVPEEEDSCTTLQNVRSSACKLAAIARIRDEIARTRPNVNFGSEATRREVDSILDGYRTLRHLIQKL
jgi:hypothetical protein